MVVSPVVENKSGEEAGNARCRISFEIGWSVESSLKIWPWSKTYASVMLCNIANYFYVK